MKKLFISISSLSAYLLLPFVSFAQTPTTGPISIDPCNKDATIGPVVAGIAKTVCDLGGGNIGNTIKNIVVFFVMLAVVIALVYLLYGGIKWITSHGDKTQVEEARNHIMAAIIGLIVVFLAIFLLSIILAAFGISFDQLKIPVIGAK